MSNHTAACRNTRLDPTGRLAAHDVAKIYVNLERYRVVRRPPFKSGAAVHVEQADPWGQCSSWSMLIRVASAAVGACRSVWPVQHLGHADLCGQCSSWSMPICVASAAVGACAV